MSAISKLSPFEEDCKRKAELYDHPELYDRFSPLWKKLFPCDKAPNLRIWHAWFRKYPAEEIAYALTVTERALVRRTELFGQRRPTGRRRIVAYSNAVMRNRAMRREATAKR